MILKKILPFIILSLNAYANDWQVWLNQVKQEAHDKGIRQSVIDEAFANVHEPSRTVKNLSKSQPEQRLSYTKYRSSRVDNYRIIIGRKRFKENETWLNDIARRYGVDPCFMVSFWGMETSYGGYMGNFPVVQALSTLAFESTRKDFFRNELFLALQILNDGHVPLSKFKGEWAGASGHPQFLPSSWMKYAVDYDGDGKKDIWSSKQDALASIANYMKQNGWQTKQPWAVFVKLPQGFNMSLEGKTIIKPVSEWDALGVRTSKGEHLPYQNLTASIIQPYGGPTFLAFPNYKMILKYNNSIYYAGSIGYLADKICQRPSETELNSSK
ncbi:MAG: lytic murein transglycosylase [Gammaproteobacteria bacterium]|nr:lytic murein transglycosylase [Gammaproteobacteria bacterium]